MARMDEAPTPDILYTETANASIVTPAAGNNKLFVDTDHILKYKNSSGTVSAVATGLTNPLTTTGDTIYSSSGTTAARLAIGSTGQVLTVAGGLPSWAASTGGVSAGTSFPGSPATSDLYFRTDRGLMYYYDGTRWLTVTLYHEQLGADPSSTRPNTTSGAGLGSMTMFHSTYDVWLEAFYGTTYVTTNSGSAYWTLTLEKRNVSDAATSIVSYTTAADTQANDVTHSTAIGALMDTTTYKKLDVVGTKTSTPGSLYWEFAVSYRLVG